MDIFSIKSSKKIENLVKRKKAGDTVYKDKRGGVKSYKYTFHDRKIGEHILIAFHEMRATTQGKNQTRNF